jgi:hypothetical protein
VYFVRLRNLKMALRKVIVLPLLEKRRPLQLSLDIAKSFQIFGDPGQNL